MKFKSSCYFVFMIKANFKSIPEYLRMSIFINKPRIQLKFLNLLFVQQRKINIFFNFRQKK